MLGKCTIYFDDPFWVGVFERQDVDGYQVARHVFGAEPGAAEILEFARQEFSHLKFSAAVQSVVDVVDQESFKHRMHRIRREAEKTGIGTYAQRAIKAEQERQAVTRSTESREKSEAADQEKFRRRQLEKKEKHRGH